ncbi:secondary thiamine-phosphate synthase enzyme YjbQ [Vibrio chagasii]|nr:secondary thiamine-phosphate synthase enzyme YjbQ [Vibrio chagasii]
MWIQKTIHLNARKRGFHLITDEIEQQIHDINSLSVGLLHLYPTYLSQPHIKRERADPTVRTDMESHFNVCSRAERPTTDTPMKAMMTWPAHIKDRHLATSVTIPISNGRLALGTWQGIYLVSIEIVVAAVL